MALSKQEFSSYIKQFKFRELFNDMGWNNDRTKQPIVVDDSTYILQAVAEKSGFKILLCNPATDGFISDYNTRKKIETKITKLFQEHLIIFYDAKQQEQIWQLVVRQTGKPIKVTETRYNIAQDPELLYQRASGLFFEMDEEENITIVDVTQRVAANFHQNAEKVTKQFYDKFKKEHISFLGFIKGIETKVDKDWYASLMLNRLMFCYFIQKKGFLDDNKNYLRDKLRSCQENKGKNKFYSFYRDFLLILFHEGLNEAVQKEEVIIEIGKIPYLNGGLFDEHELEKMYKDIDIEDKAFERVFDFFDQYEWHLDTRVTATGKDINPDVIGYIFEKYINDRAQMGAYYTKEDITEYISKNTVLPWLFDETKRNYFKAFVPDGEIWSSVKESENDYIYDAVKYGVPKEGGLFDDLPEDIKEGFRTDLEKQIGKADDSPQLWEIRKAWNKKAPAEIALPTEIYREVINRRKRYAEVKSKIEKGEITQINDFITYNLNIRQFAQDVIEKTNDPDFLRHFYKAINSVTILDPTCGSGAFLFAANILESLYEACIMRMRAFVEDEDQLNEAEKKSFSNKYKFFRNVLAETQNKNHPNLQYFIFKSIILQNLYGVDIMREAVEIAKLRLFLKLVATVDADYRKPNLGLEPLPDIDFNIRSGNTLVGFASQSDAIKAVNAKDKTGQMGLVFDEELDIVNSIKNQADDLARVFKSFKSAQLDDNLANFKQAKEKLLKYQAELNSILNEYLAFTYGINSTNQQKEYKDFLQTHQPFHWFAEFYEIIHDNGGFDVIIGNPPYVEYSKIRKQYKLSGDNYDTIECGNIYAMVFEKSIQLATKKGKIGLIVPISLGSTKRLEQLLKIIKERSSSYWSSFYAERPSKLFTGAEVLLNISIIDLLSNLNGKNFYTTGLLKWSSSFREHLFPNLYYTLFSNNYRNYLIPKFSSEIEKGLSKKFFSVSKKIGQSFTPKSSHIIFYRIGGGRYWKIFTTFQPKFIVEGKQTASSRENYLYFASKEILNTGLIALSSSTFFWYFQITTNGRDLNPFDLRNFPINYESLDLSERSKNLADNYIEDIKLHKSEKEKTSKLTGHLVYEEFYPRKSKSIIDEIDTVLAEHYGFTQEELDFIINYDIKYRMGKELEDGEDE